MNIWDTTSISNFATLSEHLGRVGSLAWNGDYLASGSRDRTICIWDHQRSHQPLHVLSMHQQEVCGLRWSHDRQMLASGGNDNKLFVWHWPSISSLKPVYKFADHMAAVKALSWSPQCNNLLASGGGTADKTIRFWNTTTGQQVQHLDTGSQVRRSGRQSLTYGPSPLHVAPPLYLWPLPFTYGPSPLPVAPPLYLWPLPFTCGPSPLPAAPPLYLRPLPFTCGPSPLPVAPPLYLWPLPFTCGPSPLPVAPPLYPCVLYRMYRMYIYVCDSFAGLQSCLVK